MPQLAAARSHGNDPTANKCRRRRLDSVDFAGEHDALQKLNRRLEAHLLKGRRIRLHPESIERPIGARECHVVGYERQVPRVDVDSVDFEDRFDFL